MSQSLVPPDGVRLLGPPLPATAEVLSPGALAFVAGLHRRFEAERQARLAARARAQAAFDAGALPGFLPETRAVREAAWTVAPPPPDLRHRRVEITGPTDRKMMVHALNSGADCFMADLEDANSPTWRNMVEGQANLRDWARGRLEHRGPDGRELKVGPDPATLIVRPRGWHLDERHVTVDGARVSASLFDAGLFLYHNARVLLERGTGPYLYLPKMEHHLEARLWEQVLADCEEALGLPPASIRVTCLVETLPAAFQMEEVLHELRGRVCGLNAGRWDYLFSVIKTFRAHPDRLLPDRARLTMEVPFLRAYARLLVHTCHRRGAYAIGGMAAFVPSRRDAGVTATAFRKVLEDKDREAADGFDGTWVAHPDLVAVAGASFDRVLSDRPNQLGVRPPAPAASALLDLEVPGAQATEQGLRHDLRAALLYLEAWLGGTGAVAIDNLMEDAATAEISRAQAWQWLRHGATLADGRRVTEALVAQVLAEERRRIAHEGVRPRLADAEAILHELVTSPELAPFLTLAAYPHLETPA
jgi:malate synthase